MVAPDIIKKLVANFAQNIEQYKSQQYNETETRIQFINPFWTALGWDVDNIAGYAMNYRDVVHEDSIRLKNSDNQYKKAPDYAFRIGGQRMFFVEAKKPFVAIKTDSSPAFQVRSYGWSCNLSLSVLTDFEEFAVYDCRIRPKNTDRADVARIKYIKFTEYVDRWDEIAEIFHRENILRGSFDRFVSSRKSKAGTSEVDAEFLREIESWREILAKDILKNNPQLDIRDLSFAVQRTLDRILFLRLAEDRGLEPEDQLWDLGKRPEIYRHLQEIYRIADEKYNSGIFHFMKQPGETEQPDTLTPTLSVSDKTLLDILKCIYPPVSPYRFDVFPVEVLGNVYEQFLGKVIRLTSTNQVKIELKPEVRKAGGVFYTPNYIVDYIVEQTVGELCTGKTPREVAKLKVLDPACGSGSFLLGAYKYLLKWHLDWYYNEYVKTGKIPQLVPPLGARKKKSDPNAIFQSVNGDWKLTLAGRKQILLNNIYGVDIDTQAVEVTKLSLCLAVLEDISGDSVESNLRLYYDRALPDLDANIRCGNSLIAPDYWLERLSINPEERYTVNAFDWHDNNRGFGKIIKSGGFDCVIGNPPYVRMQNMVKNSPAQMDYFRQKYSEFVSDNFDLYILFIQKALSLLNANGLTGNILPHKFFKGKAGTNIRRYLSLNKSIHKIVDFTTNQVFPQATTYTCLLFLSKSKNHFIKYKKFTLGEEYTKLTGIIFEQYNSKLLDSNDWLFTNPQLQKTIDHLKNQTFSFKQICKSIFKGSSTGNDKVYLFDLLKEKKNTYIVQSDYSQHPVEIEKKLLVPFLYGEDVKRYEIPLPHKLLLFPYYTNNGVVQLIPQKEMKELFPLAYAYLLSAKKELSKRKVVVSSGNFYKYSAARNLDKYQQSKILIPDMLVKNRISFDSSGSYYHGAAIHSVIFNSIIGNVSNVVYLAILNSKLFWFFIKHTSTALRGDAYRLTPEFLLSFSFPDLLASENKNWVELLNQYTERLLEINQLLQTEETPERMRGHLERERDTLDQQIDLIVYQLYGLNEEDIQGVEQDS